MKTNIKEYIELSAFNRAIDHLKDRGITAVIREDKKIVVEQQDYERAVNTLGKAYKWGELNFNPTVTTLMEHYSLESIVKRFPKEIKDWRNNGDMSDDLFHALYDYYFDEMPYGTKKARDGDPYEWVSDRLDQDLGDTELEETSKHFLKPPAGYGDYSKGATNPDGTASRQREIDREFDRQEYEYNRKKEEEDRIRRHYRGQEVDEASGAHMFVIGDTVYHDNKEGRVDRQEGNKVFVHVGNGDMDVWPADETSLTRQGAIPTMRKHINQVARGMKGFLTGRPELEESEEDDYSDDMGEDLEDQVGSALEDIKNGAEQGYDMIDNLADELNSLFDAIEQSENQKLKNAYHYAMDNGQEAEGDPALMAKVMATAINMLGKDNKVSEAKRIGPDEEEYDSVAIGSKNGKNYTELKKTKDGSRVSVDDEELEKNYKKADVDEAKNPYAVGMAQAMKSTGDKPPLKKSTIKKAHHIADVIKKKEKAEESADLSALRRLSGLK